jgi:penicillin V acylase-like amidase (Ntn superfamily)
VSPDATWGRRRGHRLVRSAGPCLAAVAAIAIALAPAAAGACTTVLLEHQGEIAIAKSYDFHMGHGLIIVNPRGLAKYAMRSVSGRRLAGWVSRFGSVTFNQYGRELPASGMNEAGLVVEVMWLDETRYPAPDERPVVPDLQWIQYQLDNWATVTDVVEHAEDVRVDSSTARVHYLVCDRTAACVAVEFLDGKMVLTTGAAMPVRTLTNSTYVESRVFLGQHAGFGGTMPIPGGAGSLERFVRASALATRAAGEDRGEPGLSDDAFAILGSVSQGPASVWNLVHDPVRRVIRYRTWASPRVKRITLSSLDFSCTTGLKALDVDAERWGDVTDSFLPYTAEMNLSIVRRSFGKHFGPVQRGTVEYVTHFAEGFRCADAVK